jgi:hypothetical protein
VVLDLLGEYEDAIIPGEVALFQFLSSSAAGGRVWSFEKHHKFT